jgi:KxDL motif-containing protein 1
LLSLKAFFIKQSNSPQGLAGIINQSDVEFIVRAQKKMLQRFEKTNEMLTNVNSLSATRLERAQNDFRKHTQNIGEMKRDLEQIFKRIRGIKAKLAAQMPEAYSQAVGDATESKGIPDRKADIWRSNC